MKKSTTMQKVIIICVLSLTSFISQAQEEEMHTVTVNISGMKSNKGNVYVALYNSKESFLKKRIGGDIAMVNDKKASVILKNIPKGVYAISTFHDENDNKKMDTYFFGIPKEPVGCSNGAKGFMGPPKYKDAKFSVTEDIIIQVKVK